MMKNLAWSLIKSIYLFKDIWFTVRKDTCVKPDGTLVSPYYVYEFPTWVTIVALTKENEVVMVRQYRHAIGEVCIEIPGGCVDPEDDNLETAARRELREETGYVFDKLEYLGKTSPNPSTNNNWMHMFLATGGVWEGKQQLDASEEILVELYTIEQVKELVRNQQVVQSMHVTCLLYAFNKLGIALLD